MLNNENLSQKEMVTEAYRHFNSILLGLKTQLVHYKKNFRTSMVSVDVLRKNAELVGDAKARLTEEKFANDIEDEVFNFYASVKNDIHSVEGIIQLLSELEMSPLEVFQFKFEHTEDGEVFLDFYIPEDNPMETMIAAYIFGNKDMINNAPFKEFEEATRVSIETALKTNEEMVFSTLTEEEVLYAVKSLQLLGMFNEDLYMLTKADLIKDFIVLADYLYLGEETEDKGVDF